MISPRDRFSMFWVSGTGECVIRQAELKDKEREAAHLAGVLSALQVARTEHVAGDLAWVGTFARAV